jgi:hypothetical protein
VNDGSARRGTPPAVTPSELEAGPASLTITQIVDSLASAVPAARRPEERAILTEAGDTMAYRAVRARKECRVGPC